MLHNVCRPALSPGQSSRHATTTMSGYRPRRRESESQPLLSSDISRATSECEGSNFMMFYQSETSDSEASPWDPYHKTFLSNLRGAFSQDQDLYSDFVPKRLHRMDPNTNKKGVCEDGGSAVQLTRQSSVVTIFAVWNTMMGTSLLAMPWGMERSGLLTGPLLVSLLGGLCLYTSFLNLRAERQFGSTTGEISELARALLGPFAELVAKIFSFVVLLGANIVYWILMCNFLFYSVNYLSGWTGRDMLEDIAHNISTTGVLCPKDVTHLHPNTTTPEESIISYVWDLHTTVPVFLALIIAPLLNFKSPTFFTKFNSLGTLSVMYLILFVFVKSFHWGVNIDIVNETSMHYSPLYVDSFPATSGMLALSYFIHNIIITIMRSNDNQKNNGRDLTIAYFLVMSTYLSIGLVFYIGFPLAKSCIQDNFLNNFSSWDYMTVAARIFLLFQLVTVFPLISYMLRVQTMVALLGDPFPSRLHVLLFNFFIVVVCVLFAIFLPKIGTIIRFTGALSGLVHVFTIPCLLRLAALKKNGKLTKTTYIVHLLIPIYGAANLLGQFFVTDN